MMGDYERGINDGIGAADTTPIPNPFDIGGAVLAEVVSIVVIIRWVTRHYNKETHDLEFSSPEANEAWAKIKHAVRKILSVQTLEYFIMAVVLPIAFVYYVLRNAIRFTINRISGGSIVPE